VGTSVVVEALVTLGEKTVETMVDVLVKSSTIGGISLVGSRSSPTPGGEQDVITIHRMRE